VDTRNERQQLGMLVDEVNEILEIPSSHLQPAPDFGTDIRTDFIQSMGRVDDVFMILLDINHVLSVEELSQLEKLGQYASQIQKDDVKGSD
jgi:purine-binding chemotaxis protein CheW